MKKLFEFTLTKKVRETEKESSTNESGEIVTTEKVVETEKQQIIFLRKPVRSLHDEAELYFGVKLSEGIKAGLLTRALLSKRFSNDGGVLSNDDKERYADLYLKLYETQTDIERHSLIEGEKDKGRVEELIQESADIRRELTDFEMAQSSLFEQTAENRARNKTILWWLLQLSHYEDEDGNRTPVFVGETFKDKLAKYDEFEESDDEFLDTLLQKLIYYVSFWYVGRVSTQEEFEKLIAENEGLASQVEEKAAQDVAEETTTQSEPEEEPVQEEPVQEEPVQEEPVQEEPVQEEPVQEEPLHEHEEDLKGEESEAGE